MGIIVRLNQLNIYAHSIATLLDTSFQDVGNAELSRDLRQIFRGAFVMLCRCTRDHLQISDLG